MKKWTYSTLKPTMPSPKRSEVQVLAIATGFTVTRHPKAGWIAKKETETFSFFKMGELVEFLRLQPVVREIGQRKRIRASGIHSGWVYKSELEVNSDGLDSDEPNLCDQKAQSAR